MSQVNHPEHYNVKGKKECIVEMSERFGVLAVLFFCVLNTYKYLYRADYKESKDQDENKARWYIKYAQDLLSKNRVTAFICSIFFPRILKYIKETNV